MKISKVGALAGVAVLTFAACGPVARPTKAPQRRQRQRLAASCACGRRVARVHRPAGTDKGTVKIAIELPLQGSELAASQPIINGIRLAIKQAGGAAGGYTHRHPSSGLRRRGQRRARPADRAPRT